MSIKSRKLIQDWLDQKKHRVTKEVKKELKRKDGRMYLAYDKDTLLRQGNIVMATLCTTGDVYIDVNNRFALYHDELRDLVPVSKVTYVAPPGSYYATHNWVLRLLRSTVPTTSEEEASAYLQMLRRSLEHVGAIPDVTELAFTELVLATKREVERRLADECNTSQDVESSAP